MADSSKKVWTFKFRFPNCSFKDVYGVVVETSLLEKDARLKSRSSNRTVLSRTRTIKASLARIFKMVDASIDTSNLTVPYEQIIDLDLANQRFMVQATTMYHKYTLQVGLLYAQDRKNVVVTARVTLLGVKNASAKAIAGNFIEDEFKACRRAELKELSSRGQIS
jgi:hypothetical protein